MESYASLLTRAVRAALQAGDVIIEVYDSDYAVEHKEDMSPLTQADRKSHDLLLAALSDPDLPVLSEEGREIPYEERKRWERLWIVDPLDGTKEFIKRNGEFTVNIALVEYGQPVVGVVYAPVHRLLYLGSRDHGSFKLQNPDALWTADGPKSRSKSNERFQTLLQQAERLPIAGSSDRPYTIVGSRSHAGPDLKNFVEEKRREHGQVEFISAGSSLKICLVAEGKADMYPRLGPTCEWDTAAGQAVAENAGAKLLDFKTGEPLRYNRADVLNPWFIVRR